MLLSVFRCDNKVILFFFSIKPSQFQGSPVVDVLIYCIKFNRTLRSTLSTRLPLDFCSGFVLILIYYCCQNKSSETNS